MNWLRAFQVVIALGLLIFVHELGHFLAAKWSGVRVEVFSFGFGPFLFSFRRGETIYALSLIPFGGYVRMTGQVDVGRVKEEEKRLPYSYLAKSPSRRAIIIVAGVTMNLVFAYILFSFAHVAGIVDVPAEIGEVAPGWPADEAGLRKGDRVLEVDGRKVKRFTHLKLAIATAKPGSEVKLLVRRTSGRIEPVTVKLGSRRPSGGSPLGVMCPTEEVRLHMGARGAVGLGVAGVAKDSPGAKAGLEKWDYIAAVDGKPFDGLDGFRKALQRAGGAEVELAVFRKGEPTAIRVTPEKRDGPPGGEPRYVIGFVPTERVMGEVEEGSPAHKAGLRQWAFIIDEVIESPDGEKAEVSWRNPDGTEDSAILPVKGEGPELVVTTVKREPLPADSFLSAWASGAVECVDSLRIMVSILYGLVSRRVPPKDAAGPIGIAQVAYRSTKYGFGYHLWLVAFISINLAVINLVPMMPLDGGLLAFLFYEAVRGRPASRRVQEAAQIAGFVLIVALIVLVTHNDIARMF